MSTERHQIYLGAAGRDAVMLEAAMATRHGLISGATGTGKTVTLQLLAERFSALGLPVFTADVKGDLSGLAAAGAGGAKIEERLRALSLEHYAPAASPVLFFDVYGEHGHPVRTTVSELGPLLLARLLELNDTQQGLLQIAFAIADDEGLLLLDLKDLRALLTWMEENDKELSPRYGSIPTQTIGAIQRRLLALSRRGGEQFFGEPALDVDDLLQRDFSGRGVISVLDARKLLQDPLVYATFLLWLLSELFEQLEEAGDLPLPKLVFFFDEAHLLFEDAPKALLEKIEQVVRLIRSKGVAVFFVTQNPLDVPNAVAAQLGTRIQHALRAFTPKERKVVSAVADGFRQNPALDVETAVLELAVGEALVSTIDADGRPTIVERVLIAPPASLIGALPEEQQHQLIARSPLRGRYEQEVDRESAYELLSARAAQAKELAPEPARRSSNRQSAGEAFVKSLVRSVGSQLGRTIARGLLGSLTRGRR